MAQSVIRQLEHESTQRVVEPVPWAGRSHTEEWAAHINDVMHRIRAVIGPQVNTGAFTLVRLDRVNTYFRLKAAEVFNDESSVRLLARLYESLSLAYSELPLDETNGIALARLAAAGFCDIGPLRARISDAGRQFIDSVQQK